MMQRLSTATENIAGSMKIVQKLANDQGLRTDVKEAVSNARDVMGKANDLVNQPDFGHDLGQTVKKVKQAATDVDVAARQLNQVMNKRAPLLHMLFGRPGKLKDVNGAEQEKKVPDSGANDPAQTPETKPEGKQN